MKERWIVSSLVSGAIVLLILGGPVKQQNAGAVNINAEVGRTPTPREIPTTPTYYSGGYGTPGNFVYTRIGFDTGKVAQPFDRTDQPPIRNLTVRNGQLRFDADRLHFELTQFDHGARGWVVDEKGKRRPAYFVTRPKDIPSLEVLERYEGTYRIGKRRLLTLSRNVFSDSFHYLELPSGRTGALFYRPNGELTGGPCMLPRTGISARQPGPASKRTSPARSSNDRRPHNRCAQNRDAFRRGNPIHQQGWHATGRFVATALRKGAAPRGSVRPRVKRANS